MEPIEGSETSAFTTQTPRNYPKENILHKEQGESLKSRNHIVWFTKRPQPHPKDFSTECDLVFPLSSNSISSLPQGHLVAASSSSSSRSPYLSFNNVFHKAVPTQYGTCPCSLPSSYCWQDIPLLSSSPLCALTLLHLSDDWSC